MPRGFWCTKTISDSPTEAFAPQNMNTGLSTKHFHCPTGAFAPQNIDAGLSGAHSTQSQFSIPLKIWACDVPFEQWKCFLTGYGMNVFLRDVWGLILMEWKIRPRAERRPLLPVFILCGLSVPVEHIHAVPLEDTPACVGILTSLRTFLEDI